MARADTIEIRMRLVVENPVPGVLHSLQDKKNEPRGALASKEGEPLAFEFSIRIAPGPKFYGEQVRSEGPERRFVYIAVGQQAGDAASCWSRRMKINIHDIAPGLLEKATKGKVLRGAVQGTGDDGTPSCASVMVTSWRAVRACGDMRHSR
jgi:hypothetical protein